MNIRDLSKARVVVIGDAMIDVWVHGRVDRISPEAPVPVFVEEWREQKPGGAGNVYENLKVLGCDVRLAKPRENLPVKTRFVVNNQQIFRSDCEDFKPMDMIRAALVVEMCERISCDVLIISDYAKGVCTPSLCQRLIKWAKERGIKVVVDPKGDDWSKYRGADVITPNTSEMRHLLSYGVPCDATILETCGDAGMFLHIEGFNLGRLHIPASGPKVVDVCGAGDTVVAVLGAALAIGADLETAARWANCAAGIVVGKHQTATVTLDELEAAWASQ